jgi:hypothetical protein
MNAAERVTDGRQQLMGTFEIATSLAASPFVDGFTSIWLAGSAILALLLARLALVRGRLLVAAGWLVAGLGLAGSAVIETDLVRPSRLDRALVTVFGLEISAIEAGGATLAAGLGIFLLCQAWPSRFARFCLILALMAALTNPLTEGIEDQLISNPENYAFVAAGEPHRFEAEPSRLLARVSAVQELSECIASLALLLGLGYVVYDERRAVISD